MQRRPSTIYALLALLVLVIGVAAWLVSSVTELHDRFARYSTGLAVAFLGLLILLLAAATYFAVHFVWRNRAVEAKDTARLRI